MSNHTNATLNWTYLPTDSVETLIEALQGFQKLHHPDSDDWARASYLLHYLFAEMANRQAVVKTEFKMRRIVAGSPFIDDLIYEGLGVYCFHLTADATIDGGCNTFRASTPEDAAHELKRVRPSNS